MSEPTREERIEAAGDALWGGHIVTREDGERDAERALDAAGVWELVAERDQLRERAEGLQRAINCAYDAAMEFGDDPQQALVCVVEWLDPAVTPLGEPVPEESTDG